jgi:UDP-glucose 4-epimerase
VLVTGGLGFIGSHTVVELLKARHSVLIVDDLSNSHHDVFDRINRIIDKYFETSACRRPEARFFNANYQDISTMASILSTFSAATQDRTGSLIDGVIHFAALKAVADSIKHPLRYYRNNINGLVNFLSLLDEHSIKTFIFSSSATVYGTLADQGFAVREEHCVHEPESYVDTINGDTCGKHILAEQGCTGLTNPYGRTKYFGEAILADLAKSDPSWTVVALRYFNPIGCDSTGLIGEDPKGIPSNLLPVVVKVMTKQYEELQIFGDDWNTPDGTAIRDFIHVSDLARGHIAALSAAQASKLKSNFRTFNLGSGRGCSVEEVASTMEEVSQLSIPRRRVGRREGDVGTCVAVAQRASDELEWTTEKSLRDACVDICNFLKIHD